MKQDRIRKLRHGVIDVALQNGVLFGRPKIQETEEFNVVLFLESGREDSW
ncbi:hypothetical protein LAV79_09140 [Peribacillus butanolivorans]